ncbi:MAG: phosphatase PAP2 family protein [Brumimicrobium sp.]|nr:phosphatase PAP2 family protein [Brumimicrobium sp.]
MKTTNKQNGIYFGIFLLIFFLVAWISQTSIGVAVDEFGHELGNRPQSDVFTQIMELISKSGTLAIVGFSLLFSIIFAWKRKWVDLIFYYFVLIGGIIFNLVLKEIARRPRPEGREFYELFGHQLESFSFPSGHTMRATILFLVLVIFVFKYVKNQNYQKLAVTFCLFYILLMGFSRIMLNMHFITDVVGAIAASFAWVFLCLILMHFVTRRFLVK